MSTLAPVVVRDLSVSFRSTPAFTGVDLVAAPGRRVALIGENGSGKSTLLRAIAGTLPKLAQLSGSVEAPSDLVRLSQEPPFRDSDTIATVLATTLRPLREAVAEVERLAAQLDDPASASRYVEVLEWATAHDAWDADRRARVAAEDLGLGDLAPDRSIGSLSGGQRTRLALATAIARRPAALLLDEPTNHLDDDAVDVLSAFLRELPGAVIFASHDRVFLDDLSTDLIDLDPSAYGTDGYGGRHFGGGWSLYEADRRAARTRWEQTYAEQQDELSRLRSATRIGTDSIAHNRGPRDNDKHIYSFKGANVERALARRKKDARRRLDEAERTQLRKPPPPLRLRTDLGAGASGGRVVLVRNLEVPHRLRLPVLDLPSGEPLLVSGANGTGKSTLLGVLAGRVAPYSGTVQVGARRVAELVQDPVFPDPRQTPNQAYRAAAGDERAAARPLRDLGLMHPRDLVRPIGVLSLGQRRRLALALVVADEPDLLLLDEPTNHLSLALAGELEEAVGRTTATIVVATHDRWLRRRWEGRELRLQESTCVPRG